MSTQTFLKECPICCVECIPMYKVLFFQCGHYVCKTCYGKASKPECLLCRQPVTSAPHRIFMGPGEIIEKEIRKRKHFHTLDGLDMINQDTPVISVEKASGRIKKLHENEGSDPTVAADILRGMKNLEKRIAPMFRQLADVKELNGKLQQQLRVAELSKTNYKSKALKVNLEIEKEREETERQRQRADKYRILVKEKDVDIQKLQDDMTAREREINLIKTKLKAIAKGQKRKPRRSSVADASLLIEGVSQSSPRIKLHKPSKSSLQDVNTDPTIRRVKRRKSNNEDITF